MRWLKILGILIASLLGLVAVALGVVYLVTEARLHRKFEVTVRDVSIPTDAAALERGHHLVITRGCAECHGEDLGGKEVVDDLLLGTAWGANLTRGAGGVTADFSDADWVRAIRHGVAPDGRPLFLMPADDMDEYSDADVGAIIAYAKPVPPVDRPTVPVRVGPLGRVLMLAGQIQLAADVIDHDNVHPADVALAPTAEYGHYLAATCAGCHGHNMAGGKIPGGPPDWPPAANLTRAPSTDFATWTEQDFYNGLRTHRRPDGRELDPVMPRALGQLNDTELKALWMYIQTLPPVAATSS